MIHQSIKFSKQHKTQPLVRQRSCELDCRVEIFTFHETSRPILIGLLIIQSLHRKHPMYLYYTRQWAFIFYLYVFTLYTYRQNTNINREIEGPDRPFPKFRASKCIGRRSVQHKTPRSTDFEAHTFLKGQSGRPKGLAGNQITVCPPISPSFTWPNISQFWSLEIRRRTNWQYLKNADGRIMRLQSREMLGRVLYREQAKTNHDDACWWRENELAKAAAATSVAATSRPAFSKF